MIRILDDTRKLIYDGLEAGFYGSHFVDFDSKRFQFSLRDLKGFESLADVTSKAHFDQLREVFEIDEKALGDAKYYRKGNLEVEYLITDEILILISNGESQPGRYVIYLESIFDLKTRLNQQT